MTQPEAEERVFRIQVSPDRAITLSLVQCQALYHAIADFLPRRARSWLGTHFRTTQLLAIYYRYWETGQPPDDGADTRAFLNVLDLVLEGVRPEPLGAGEAALHRQVQEDMDDLRREHS